MGTDLLPSSSVRRCVGASARDGSEPRIGVRPECSPKERKTVSTNVCGPTGNPVGAMSAEEVSSRMHTARDMG